MCTNICRGKVFFACTEGKKPLLGQLYVCMYTPRNGFRTTSANLEFSSLGRRNEAKTIQGDSITSKNLIYVSFFEYDFEYASKMEKLLGGSKDE